MTEEKIVPLPRAANRTTTAFEKIFSAYCEAQLRFLREREYGPAASGELERDKSNE
jgi:hypothetical protein